MIHAIMEDASTIGAEGCSKCAEKCSPKDGGNLGTVFMVLFSCCAASQLKLRYMKTRVMRHEEMLEDAEGNFVGYYTVGVMLAADTHQMQESPAALCMLEGSVALVRKSFCWMRKKLFECDGASNYQS
jgi:hypothetical protein